MLDTQKVSSALNLFKSDEKGSIIPMTALMMSTLLITAGAAYDYSILSQSRTKMNDALDSAILATGKQLLAGDTSAASLRQRFDDFYFTNLSGLGALTKDHQVIEFNVDFNTGEVKAVTQSTYNTSFMAVTGLTSVNVVSSGAGIFEQKETEVALMLDLTGSMNDPASTSPDGDSKLDGLKDAASAAVEKLLESDNVRVALAPYSAAVNANVIGAAGQSLTSIVSRGQSSPCVTERSGVDENTDVTFEGSFLARDTTTCPNATVRPLTTNSQLLLDDIKDYSGAHTTAGHMGIAWSYYMLSPKWKAAYSNASKPAEYSKDVDKIAILMTDGIFNKAYTGVEGPTRSTQLAEDLCADMKAEKSGNPGITVYAIAFDAPPESEKLLRECATPDTDGTQYFYAAATNEELVSAFEEIANNIQSLRLSR
ncbi:MAG: hypothetical protein AAGF54_08615 [Pseudomonadota bacterium]